MTAHVLVGPVRKATGDDRHRSVGHPKLVVRGLGDLMPEVRVGYQDEVPRLQVACRGGPPEGVPQVVHDISRNGPGRVRPDTPPGSDGFEDVHGLTPSC
jgi:hypothetical protein